MKHSCPKETQRTMKTIHPLVKRAFVKSPFEKGKPVHSPFGKGGYRGILR